MAEVAFLWPIHAPEAQGLRVLAEIGLVEGVDFVRDGGGGGGEDVVFRFATTEQAMQFNRAVSVEPGRAP
ncbi:hypothetical protein [Arenibaculum pallidiluteum]|uniref:hypothetical protein n=1 Tax=Arenibaculum pallidiluteum TaxID=2812559 RepID=UPI001A96310F|nr:hypothetical protein [Arenibaculum pallidiluteum]